MSNDLQMTYVIMRLVRWSRYVRWLHRGGTDPRPAHLRSWWGKLVQAKNPRPEIGPAVADVCPVDVAEALETWKCVKALPEHLYETMVEEYLIGGSSVQISDALGIDTSTLWRRRNLAHSLLLGLFNDVAAGIEPVCEAPKVGRPRAMRAAAA